MLFNGGVFKAPLLVERDAADAQRLARRRKARRAARLLEGADLDLAVARGAAYYGYVRRGKGVRIRGGTARAYYVGVESAMPAVPGLEPPVQALCVAPFGMEEGTDAELPAQEFGLVVGEPVRFRFFGSSVRRQDQVGTMLEYWQPDELQELDEIEAIAADRRPHAGRSRAGEAACARHRGRHARTRSRSRAARSERWKVEFDVRGGVGVNQGMGCKRPRARKRLDARATRVGIDLGTSNTVVAYVDGAGPSDIRVFDDRSARRARAKSRRGRSCRRCAITRRPASSTPAICNCRGRAPIRRSASRS